MKRTVTKKPVKAEPETLVKAKPVEAPAPKSEEFSWPFYWHASDKVVRSSSTGLVDVNLTNIARKKRGLLVPWTVAIHDIEKYQKAIP